MKNSLRILFLLGALVTSSVSHALSVDERNSTLISEGISDGFGVEVGLERAKGLYAKVTVRAKTAESLPAYREIERVCFSAIIRAELQTLGQPDLQLGNFKRPTFLWADKDLVQSDSALKIEFTLPGYGTAEANVDLQTRSAQSIYNKELPFYTTMYCVVGTPTVVGPSGLKVDIPPFSRPNVSRAVISPGRF